MDKKTQSGICLAITNSILIGILGYLIRITLAKNCSIEDFGFIYAAISLLSLIASFIGLGAGQGVMILMSKLESERREMFSTFLFSRLAWCTFWLIILMPFMGLISEKYLNTPSGDLAILLLMFSSLLTIINGTFYITLDVLQSYFIRNLLQLISPLITFAFLRYFLPLNINEVAAAFLLGTVSVTICLSIFMKSQYQLPIKPTWKSFKKHLSNILSFSIWIAISTAGFAIMHNIDTLMLVELRTLKEVGLYNGALSLIQIALTLFAFIPKVFLPKIASKAVQKPKQTIRLIHQFQLFILTSCLLGLTVAFFIIDDIIALFFTDKFLPASQAAFILCCGVPFYAMSLLSIGYLQSIKKEKKIALIIIISLIINFTCNFLLIPAFGINGAASATLITYLSIFCTLHITISKHTKLTVA